MTVTTPKKTKLHNKNEIAFIPYLIYDNSNKQEEGFDENWDRCWRNKDNRNLI